MNALVVNIPSSGGIHSETDFNSSGNLELSPKPLFNPFIGDRSIWQLSGKEWTQNGDSCTLVNTDSGNDFLTAISAINQSVATAVTYRVTANAEDIAAGGHFGIELTLTDAGGLGGTILADQTIHFNAGSFNDTQFTITLTPTGPAYYVYAYIFARYTTGTLTVKRAEVFQQGGTKSTYGKYVSDPVDVQKAASVAINKSGLDLKNWGFYYEDLSNADGLESAQHSVDVLSNFKSIVCNEPGLNTTQQQQYVQQQLIKNGVQLYGYCQVGASPGGTAPTIASMEAICDRCAAAGYAGVFWDMFGYDYHVTRSTQNTMTQYAHSKGLSCMANAWNPPDALGNTVDATYNPTGVASALGPNDWYLFESFYSRDDNQYAGVPEGGFSTVLQKYTSGVSLAKALGVKTCGLAYQMNTIVITDYSDYINAYALAVGLGMDGLSYSPGTSNGVQPWTTPPPTLPAFGTTLTKSLSQVDATNYEAQTDAGVIVFSAVDSPVSRSSSTYQTGVSQSIQAGTVPAITADRPSTAWEVQQDGTSPWVPYTADGSIKTTARYARWTAELRNN